MSRLALALTLVRLPLAALLWVRPGDPAWTLTLMVLAGVSDVLDGRAARAHRARRGKTADAHDPGAWLDPACDKVFLASAAGAVVWAVQPPLWILPVLGAREILQIPLLAALRLRGSLRRFDFRAAPAGKLATALQFAAVVALLCRHPLALPLAVAAGVVGAASVAVYAARARRT
jgi:phosphatidylglycerophosphate synthase